MAYISISKVQDCFLLSPKMIVKIFWTKRTTQQYNGSTQKNLTDNGSKNQQQINNNTIITFGRSTAVVTGVGDGWLAWSLGIKMSSKGGQYKGVNSQM